MRSNLHRDVLQASQKLGRCCAAARSICFIINEEFECFVTVIACVGLCEQLVRARVLFADIVDRQLYGIVGLCELVLVGVS